MDSFEINKILGAVLGTLTFVLGLSIVSEVFFHVPMPEKPGYEIAVAEATHGGGGESAAAVVEPIAVRLAKADAAKGENVAKRCASCHSFEKGGPNKVGPDLWGVVERDRGAHEGFGYSAGMKAAGGKWTYENLDHFLENPKGAVPGTAMSFAGLKKPEERADIIAYLRTLSDSPAPLPEAGAAPAPASDAPAGNEGKPQEPLKDSGGGAHQQGGEPAKGGKPAH